MRLPQCIAISTLRSFGVDHGKVRAPIEKHVSKRNTDYQNGANIRLSLIVQKSLLAAVKEANMSQHPYMGTRYLLLGISREDDKIATNMLPEAEVKVENCRQGILLALDPNFVSIADGMVTPMTSILRRRKCRIGKPNLRA
jgi:ATP-dependent Clp protease ATP-binding subunit ClpA